MNINNDDELVAHLAEDLRRRLELEQSNSARYYAGIDGDEKAARATIAEFLRLCEEGEITPVHVEDQDNPPAA